MKMMRTLLGIVAVVSLYAVVAQGEEAMVPALLPQPVEMKVGKDTFTFDAHASISAAPEAAPEARYLAAALAPAMGFTLAINPHGLVPTNVALHLVPIRSDLGDEGYALHVTHDGVLIEAAKPAGLFYGIQTLRELLPPPIFSKKPVSAVQWMIPCVEITDRPRLAWRGFMLDVSRHFFDKIEVETLLEQMALLKLNVFHWHLTDDHGWRIEIKKYPKLTSIGAWRFISPQEKGGTHIQNGQYGGFYTQDDIREIVAFAGARHIQVIPEVDMPGHMSAVAVAYPELSPANGWTPIFPAGLKENSPATARCAALCVGRAETVEFCKDVLTEVMQLFPSKEIHIGGDEVFYEQWESCPDMQALKQKLAAKDWAEVQVQFTNEMIAFLAEHGRTAICWNNIYRETVDKRSINQFWRDMKPAREFANSGYTVLVSDSSHYYFDHHPPLEKAYMNDPLNIPKLSPQGLERIPGIEGCAWTERVPSLEVLYQHIYPLLFAYAETGWTPQQNKDWKSFSQRVDVQASRLGLTQH